MVFNMFVIKNCLYSCCYMNNLFTQSVSANALSNLFRVRLNTLFRGIEKEFESLYAENYACMYISSYLQDTCK